MCAHACASQERYISITCAAWPLLNHATSLWRCLYAVVVFKDALGISECCCLQMADLTELHGLQNPEM